MDDVPAGWVQAIKQLGLPTVFAAVLLWFVLWKLSGTFDVVVAELRQQTQTLRAMQEHIEERDRR
jgi:hypothetical protein